MRDLIVDGVPLRDPLGEWSLDYTRSTMLPALTADFDSDQEYGFHGLLGTQPEAYFGTGVETWVINIESADKDAHVQILSGLAGLLSRPRLSVVSAPQRSALSSPTDRSAATFAVSSDVQRIATMRKVGTLTPDRVDERTMRLTAVMETLGAFWQSANLYTTGAFAMTADTVTAALSGTTAESEMPIVDGLVRIKGPISTGGTMTVQDRGNPFRSVRYTASTALGSGEYVLIDFATLVARLSSSASWDITAGTDVSSRVTTSGDGMFCLTPAPGAAFPATSAAYSATLVGVGDSTATTVEIRLRRSFSG